MGLQRVTGGLQVIKLGSRGLQEVTRGKSRLLRATEGYKALQGVTGG